MGKKKFYVVWNGVNPGIYDNWIDCRLQIAGYGGARFKSFDSFEAAREAFEAGYTASEDRAPRPVVTAELSLSPYIRESLAVDAACSGNPGRMEYRGVHVATGEEWFHVGPLQEGTNNVGEFLAIVHGLAFMKRAGLYLPLYSDSQNAIKWIGMRQCRTTLVQTDANTPLFDLITRAVKWLATNEWQTPVLKWDTAAWGEIPADFGRK
ncbi:MAG: ribonuclease H family protein [Tannerella sp.]|jgi:ribonuclease HI|nr:ribonuclease H family protein [Tannerella sp.]